MDHGDDASLRDKEVDAVTCGTEVFPVEKALRCNYRSTFRLNKSETYFPYVRFQFSSMRIPCAFLRYVQADIIFVIVYEILIYFERVVI